MVRIALKLFDLLTVVAVLLAGVFAASNISVMADKLFLVNPKKRRTTRRRRPRTYKKRKVYRSNPARLSVNSVLATAKAGAVGAMGALGVDYAMRWIPLPATLATSRFMPAVRGLVGVGLGYIFAKFLKQRKLGEELATGAVVVSLYGVAKNMAAGVDAQAMAGLDFGGNGLLGLGYYKWDDEREAATTNGNGVGYMNAAPTNVVPMQSGMGYYNDPGY